MTAEPAYNTIVVDPPWAISMAGGGRNVRHSKKFPKALPYKTMTQDEIRAFPLSQWAAPGAHVYLWTTSKMLHEAFHVLEGWGVSFHLALPMVKTSGIAPAMGYVFGSEFCLLGFYGRPMQRFKDIGALNWLTVNPTSGQHSRKPDIFYDLVERMSPGPYIDLFARRRRLGWDAWGDEV